MFTEHLLCAWVQGNKTERFPLQEPRVPQQGGQTTGLQVLGQAPRETTPTLAWGCRILSAFLPSAEGQLEPRRSLLTSTEGCHVRLVSAGTCMQVAGGGESPALPQPPGSPLNEH